MQSQIRLDSDSHKTDEDILILDKFGGFRNHSSNYRKFTQVPYVNPSTISSPSILQITICSIIYSLIIIIGIASNVAVIISNLFTRNIKLATHLYVTNLAICDLVFICLCSTQHWGALCFAGLSDSLQFINKYTCSFSTASQGLGLSFFLFISTLFRN